MSTVGSRDRASLVLHLRMAAAITGTSWIAMWSWRDFTMLPAQYILGLVAVGLAVGLTGALTRWRRLPGIVVVLAQLVVGGAVTCQVVAARPYPGDRFWSALSGAVDAANTYASPVPRTDDVTVQPLLVVGGFVAMLLVDLCAGTWRRVPLAGLPLLTVYSVPVSLVDRGLSWWVFAATAAGFLTMLYLQEEEHLSRWGRSLDGSTEPVRRLSDSVRSSAVSIGVLATAAAVLLPLVIPTFSFSVFDVGPGRGDDGEIQVSNPMVDLRQDLVRGDDVDLITVRTTDPSPDHLRISVLNRFTDNEWSAGDRRVPTANVARGAVPVDAVEGDLVTYEDADYDVQVADAFRSLWLPTQAPVNAVDAAGDWRYDDTTLDFLASDDDLTTAGLDYTMTAALPTYDDDALLRLDTSPAAAAPELTALPSDLPAAISAYAREATRGGTTDFERAVLLSQWFREGDRFTYALPEDPEGAVGTGELVDFLDPDGGRTGYCEQFAAAMGVMARDLGIPARVAVGFLQPSRVDGTTDTWVYSAHDLHAWVELYFPNAGWVLFDPTPPDRTGTGPAYADQPVTTDVPSDSATNVPTEEPSDRETRPTEAAPTDRPEPVAPTTTDTDDGASFPWVTVLVSLAVLVLLLAVLLLPRTLRGRQRQRRLAGGPEAAWEELRATVVDLRMAWPEGRSPRATRDVLVGWFGTVDGRDQRPARGPERAPDAVAALDHVVDRLERVRYSRSHVVEPGILGADVERICAALAAGATPRTRRRAQWLPVSVTQRRRVTEAEVVTEAGEPELVGRAEVL